MAWIVDYEKYGQRFIMVYMGEGESGVIIDPSIHNLDDPDVIAALKEAVQAYPFIKEIECWLEFHHYRPSESTLYEAELMQRKWRKRFAEPYVPLQQYIDKVLSMPESTPPKRPQRNPRPGYVYLLKSEKGYKIGYSIRPQDRLKTFHIKLPFHVEYEHLIATDDMVETERKLHRIFAHKHINGEWFDLSPEDVEYVKSF
jgi:hypothetical protein